MLSRLINSQNLPTDRAVVRFDLTDSSRPNRYWVVASRKGNEVCVASPGFAEDGVVTTDAQWLVRWHTGAVPLGAAVRDGGMTVAAPRWLVRELNVWGRLSPFAGVTPARA